MSEKLTLGFSPCPNDCFIFDAMLHGRIDTEGLEFDVRLEDVETLNKRAFAGEADVTKLSYHAFAYCMNNYVLLDSGSALGHKCGPLLISKKNISLEEALNGDLHVGIPGKYTTANFLLSLAFPNVKTKTEMVFSAIEQALLNDTIDAGVIIHENRFTYEEKGLRKIIDLGEYWEETSHMPIPLGGIVIRRNLPQELKEKVERVLRRSVVYAMTQPDDSMPYVKEHAQEMSEDVMRKHINLYVNDYSISLGEKGRKAVEVLFAKAEETGLVPKHELPIFLT